MRLRNTFLGVVPKQYIAISQVSATEFSSSHRKRKLNCYVALKSYAKEMGSSLQMSNVRNKWAVQSTNLPLIFIQEIKEIVCKSKSLS